MGNTMGNTISYTHFCPKILTEVILLQKKTMLEKSASKEIGLELALCKRLIEQSNSTVSVFNNPEGRATSVITLPEKS